MCSYFYWALDLNVEGMPMLSTDAVQMCFDEMAKFYEVRPTCFLSIRHTNTIIPTQMIIFNFYFFYTRVLYVSFFYHVSDVIIL